MQNSSNTIGTMTFLEVEREIARLPVLVLPIGGCEPNSVLGTMGVSSQCAEAIAIALSIDKKVLCAPVLSYSCSTPYMSFGGTSGIKPHTFTNILCEMMKMWYFQGIRRVVVIDMVYDNFGPLLRAEKQLKARYPDFSIGRFSFHREERIRAFLGNALHGSEPGPSEAGILSLAAFLRPDLVRAAGLNDLAVSAADPKKIQKWRKCGADPELLRKLTGNGSMSDIAQKYNACVGKELFDIILCYGKELING